MLKRTLISLLNCSELTIKQNRYYINYYKGNGYEISFDIFNKLNLCDLLLFDSGNTEFKEEHYILNCTHGLSLNYLLNIKRTLNYIRRKNAEIYNYKIFSKDIQDILLELEMLEERYFKIQKIKNKIKNGERV